MVDLVLETSMAPVRAAVDYPNESLSTDTSMETKQCSSLGVYWTGSGAGNYIQERRDIRATRLCFGINKAYSEKV